MNLLSIDDILRLASGSEITSEVADCLLFFGSANADMESEIEGACSQSPLLLCSMMMIPCFL